MLSSLAEGAESLVARAALECGACLIVALPLPRAEYERTFTTAEALAEFRALLDLARNWFALEWAGDNTADNCRHDPARLDLQYAQAAAYTVWNSQILLALWNGIETEPASQTVRIVRYKSAWSLWPPAHLRSTLGFDILNWVLRQVS